MITCDVAAIYGEKSIMFMERSVTAKSETSQRSID